jgi:hypothetical protein
MNDAPAMGFGQTPANLHGDGNGLRGVEAADFLDEAAKIFASDIGHGDIGDAVRFVQVEDAGHVFVNDLAGGFKFGPETIQGFPVSGRFGFDEFESDLLIELPVENPVNPAHAAFAQSCSMTW